MSPNEAAQRLVEYIQSLPDFVRRKVDDPYGHIGATIADAVLQPQRDYQGAFYASLTARLKPCPSTKP